MGIDCLGLVTLQISGMEHGVRKLKRFSLNIYCSVTSISLLGFSQFSQPGFFAF